MSEPPTGQPPTGQPPRPLVPPRPAAAPFRPQQVSSSLDPGWRRPLAIGCGALLLVVFAGLVALTFKAYDLVAWTLEAMEEEIVDRLGTEVGDDERRRLAAAVDAASARAAAREIDPEALQALQRRFMAAARRERLDAAELEELIVAFERLGAGESAPSATGPPE